MTQSVATTRTTSRYVDDSRDVRRVFTVLRNEGATLHLEFSGIEDTYTARILDVTSSSFYLHQVCPRDGMQRLIEGRGFSVSGRAGGVFVYVTDNRVSEQRLENDHPCFVVRLPQGVLYHRRRRATRFQIPPSLAPAGVDIDRHRNEPLRGRIIDLSVGGCRAEFSAHLDATFELDQAFSRCALSVSNLLEVSARGVVRHFNDQSPTRALTCGIEFVDMPAADRRRLEQFIQLLATSADRP